jgi:hypothetical protein
MCSFASDNQCDDGGPGADYMDCLSGTDCDDCCPRGVPPSPPSPPPRPPRPPPAASGTFDVPLLDIIIITVGGAIVGLLVLDYCCRKRATGRFTSPQVVPRPAMPQPQSAPSQPLAPARVSNQNLAYFFPVFRGALQKNKLISNLFRENLFDFSRFPLRNSQSTQAPRYRNPSFNPRTRSTPPPPPTPSPKLSL